MASLLKQRSTLDAATGINIKSYAIGPQKGGAHTHEFTEISLVRQGEIEHVINDHVELLTVGTLLLIRPDDCHCFAGKREDGCELVNLAFPNKWLKDTARFLDLSMEDLLAAPMPPRRMLSAQRTEQVATAMLDLIRFTTSEPTAARQRTRAIIADLLAREFAQPPAVTAPDQTPAWFQRLLSELNKPNVFLQGIPAFRRLTAKSQAQVCRAFRRYLGIRPTDHLNELRLQYAADLLIHTDREILDIADAASFESVSHFYRLFRQRFHTSPRRFRLTRQADALPPQ